MVSTETLIALLGVCLVSLLLPPYWPMLVLGIAALYALGLCLSHEATRGQSDAETSAIMDAENGENEDYE
ncbi:unnamed protein product, partial [Mesocestoides corti]|uniref:Conserved membrane protein n=1 Tax=Mesocestoides corti TaxID=53468 RepID=A0A0R3U809_MESCO